MGRYHPTCHKVSLTTTTKLVAFFDMAFGLFGLVWFVVMLSRYSLISLDPFENLASSGVGTTRGVNSSLEVPMDSAPPPSPTMGSQTAPQPVFAVNHKVISLSLVAFYTAVNLSVFVLLMVGVYKRSAPICLVWFHIRCAIFVFKLIILIMYLIGGRPLFNQIPFIFSMIVHLYGLWVVNAYVDELKDGKHQQKFTSKESSPGGGGGNTSDQPQEQSQDPSSQKNPPEPDIYDIPNGIEAILKSRLDKMQQLRALREKENI